MTTSALFVSIAVPTLFVILLIILSVLVAKYFIMPHRFSYWAPAFFFLSFFPLILVVADISLAAKLGDEAGSSGGLGSGKKEATLMRGLYNALTLLVTISVLVLFPVLVVFVSAMHWRRHHKSIRKKRSNSPREANSPLLNEEGNNNNANNTTTNAAADGRKLLRYCAAAFVLGLSLVITLSCVGAYVFKFQPYIGEIVGDYSAWFAQVFLPLQHSSFNRAGTFLFTALSLLGIVPFAFYTSFGMVHIPFVFLWGPSDVVALCMNYDKNMALLGRVETQIQPLTREGVSATMLTGYRSGREERSDTEVVNSSLAFVVAAYAGRRDRNQPTVTELEQAEHHYALTQAKQYLHSQITPVQSLVQVADRRSVHALHDGASPGEALAQSQAHLADPSSSSSSSSSSSRPGAIRRVASTLIGAALLFVSLSIAAGMMQAHLNAALHSKCGNKCGTFLVKSHASWPNPLDIFLASLFRVPFLGEATLCSIFIYMLMACFCGMSVIGVRVPPFIGDCCGESGGRDPTRRNRNWGNLLLLRRKVTTPSRFFAATVCMMVASVCFALQLMFASPHFFTFATQNFFATNVPCDVLALGTNTNCQMTELSKRVFATTLSRPWLASVFFFTGVSFDVLFSLVFAYRFFSGRPSTPDRITHFDAL